MESSFNWVLSDLTTWDNNLRCPHLTCTNMTSFAIIFLSNDCNYYKKTIQSLTLIVLLWKSTILQHTQVNCFYVWPTFADFNVRSEIFIFLKIVNLLKSPWDDQFWTPVKNHFKYNLIFIFLFKITKQKKKETVTLMSAKNTFVLEKD